MSTTLRVYVDTSVIGGCADEEFQGPSRSLFDRVRRGDFILVLSGVTMDELRGAPPVVRDVLATVPEDQIEVLERSADADTLASRYIEAGVLGVASRADALHIAIATLAGVDVLVSWNFKHIVNFHRIRSFNAVNVQCQHSPLDIRTPSEILEP